MKSLSKVAFAALLITPVLSHAYEPVTRAQVRHELEQLELAGYDPADEDGFPTNLKHAQAVLAQRGSANGDSNCASSGVVSDQPVAPSADSRSCR